MLIRVHRNGEIEGEYFTKLMEAEQNLLQGYIARKEKEEEELRKKSKSGSGLSRQRERNRRRNRIESSILRNKRGF